MPTLVRTISSFFSKILAFNSHFYARAFSCANTLLLNQLGSVIGVSKKHQDTKPITNTDNNFALFKGSSYETTSDRSGKPM